MVERDTNIQESLQQYKKDAIYFDTNREQLAKDHPASYVGILGEKVVGEAKTMQELIDKMVDDGLKPGYVYVGHTDPANRIIIVPSTRF